ncbi:MAG: hypothetical protein IJR72_02920 [Oscillospiraceae bacterium]|nr:hypothetical protein [Oscillospiraceae bacterium]
MATDSIFHMIHLTDPKEIERFIETLEEAERWAMEHKDDKIDVPPCREMTDEEVRAMFDGYK